MESQKVGGRAQRILYCPQIRRMVPDLPVAGRLSLSHNRKSVINPSHPVGVVARVIFSDPSANAPAPTETTIALQQIESGRVGLRGVLRIAAMALIAMALTFAALLWIMHTTQLTPRT